MIRVLLIDDHPVVRHGLREILSGQFDASVIGEADDGISGLARALDAEWDVVVLDLTMPGPTGLDVIKQLRERRPRLPILVLSVHPANQFARRALRAGASAYLTKGSAPTELIDAIEQLRRKGRYVSATSHDTVTGPARKVGAHDELSDREYQTLRMLGSGRTVSEIARELRLSVKTVSTYRARILEKLDMRTNVEIMRYVIENGLLDS